MSFFVRFKTKFQARPLVQIFTHTHTQPQSMAVSEKIGKALRK
jgi:hypothetical protein